MIEPCFPLVLKISKEDSRTLLEEKKQICTYTSFYRQKNSGLERTDYLQGSDEGARVSLAQFGQSSFVIALGHFQVNHPLIEFQVDFLNRSCQKLGSLCIVEMQFCSKAKEGLKHEYVKILC